MVLNNFRALIRMAVGLSIVIFGTRALADEKADFLKLIQDPEEQQLVLDAAKHSYVVLQNPCPAANFTPIDQFAIYEPLKFDTSGKITAGAWKQSVSEKGCGQDRQLNVLLFVDNSNKGLKAVSLLPGTTRANAILQRDAVMYAFIASTSTEGKDCKTPYIADTKFLHEAGEPLEGVKDNPWDELWTVNICTKKAQVIMHFVPDSTGTTIHTSIQETKFLPANSNP